MPQPRKRSSASDTGDPQQPPRRCGLVGPIRAVWRHVAASTPARRLAFHPHVQKTGVRPAPCDKIDKTRRKGKAVLRDVPAIHHRLHDPDGLCPQCLIPATPRTIQQSPALPVWPQKCHLATVHRRTFRTIGQPPWHRPNSAPFMEPLLSGLSNLPSLPTPPLHPRHQEMNGSDKASAILAPDKVGRFCGHRSESAR